MTMVSPLEPVLAGIFMVELEKAIIPKLSQHLQFRERYVSFLSYEIEKRKEYNLSCHLNHTQQTHVFIENLQIYTYTSIGIHLRYLHGK